MRHYLNVFLSLILIVSFFALIREDVSASDSGDICSDTSNGYFPKQNALLWRIDHDDTEHTSYIFGTIHLGYPELMEVADEMLDKTMPEVASVWVELLASDMDLETSFEHILMEDRTLEDLLSEEDYELVTRYIQDSIGLPMQLANRIKPLYIHSIIMMLNQVSIADMEAVQDMRITRRAREEGKSLHALETVEEQYRAMDAIPLQEQADELVNSLKKGRDAMDAELDDLISMYLNGNLAGLAELADKYPSYRYGRSALIDDRNRTMWERASPVLKEESVLIAVGALHLSGETGLLRELCDAGYDLEVVDLK